MEQTETDNPLDRKLTLVELPNEIQCKILSWISAKTDLDSVTITCHRWHAIIDEIIGREITISRLDASDENSGTEECPHLGNLDVEAIGKLGVKACFVNLKLQAGQEHSNFLPGFKYKYLLRHLYLGGDMFSDLFRKLLFGVHNLSVLVLELGTLATLSGDDVKSIHLPNLKTLCVKRYVNRTGCDCYKNYLRWRGPLDQRREREGDSLGLPNFNLLLQENVFPRLRELDVRFPAGNIAEFGTTVRGILTFHRKHLNLKKLAIIMKYSVRCLGFLHSEKEFQELLHETGNPLAGLLKLEQVEFEGIFRRDFPHPQIILEFLQLTTCLKKLTIKLGDVPGRVLKKICTQNQKTLEQLFLYKQHGSIWDEDEDTFELDCQHLRPVVNLKALYAAGTLPLNTKNTKALPLSLTAIHIYGRVLVEDAEHILLNLPNLRYIYLASAFNRENGCGVSLLLLEKFVQAKKVKRLVLEGDCLNEPFPLEGVFSGDPENEGTSVERLTQLAPFCIIDWELHPDTGYYVNKPDGLYSLGTYESQFKSYIDS